MNISLIGYGKMGREIEQLCIKKGHHIYSIVDPTLGTELRSLIGTDIAIEFTQPTAVLDNIAFCLDHGIPIVCGTTGWHEYLDQVKKHCISSKGSMFYSSNFSIGVNLFWKISKYLMELLDTYPEYALGLHEIHHDQKKDAPSGTAVILAQNLLSKSKRFKDWHTSNSFSQTYSESIPISSERKGDVPGFHEVEFRSVYDKITLSHDAFSRGGFVAGVVSAAEWLPGKVGFFGMEDLFSTSHM
jgi:4-hydroxy-tetrahydrodipicolinate reductase